MKITGRAKVTHMYQIDIASETRLDLKSVARREGVHFSTVWRWALRGVKGVRLPTVQVGGRRYTTAEAFQWWSRQLTAIANGDVPRERTSRQRAKAIEAAERELERMGV